MTQGSAGQRAQEVVFTLFGDYLLHDAGPVRVGGLIRLLEPLGLSAGAARTVLSRMVRRGWLASERGRYALTERARRLLEEGEARIHHPPRATEWDGGWHLVTYSIPEESRPLRDRLRVRLSWLGFGSVGNGVWISPHPVAEAVAELAREMGVAEHLEVFRATHLGFSEPRRLVARAWDLGAVAARYQRFLARHAPELEAAEASQGTLDPRESFVRRFRLIHEYRAFPLIDPYLPRPLLPEEWPEEAAAGLFERFHALLTEPALRFVGSVLDEETAGTT